nr:hypothetical protein [Trichlorobacter lovleyi]
MGLALDEPHENDDTIDLNGIELFVEKATKVYLEGQMIDFINSGYRQGFVIMKEWRGTCT